MVARVALNRVPVARLLASVGLAVFALVAGAQECAGVCSNAQKQRNTGIQAERAYREQQQPQAGYQRPRTIEETLAAQDAAATASVIRENQKKEREYIRNVLPTLPRFGALATTGDGKSVGTSKMAMSQWDADQLALSQCGVEGCNVAHQYQNACLSLMEVTQADGRVGFGWQTTAKGEAPTCKGTSCKTVETACSVPGGELPINMREALAGAWGALAVNIKANKRAVATHQSAKSSAENEAVANCDMAGYAQGQSTCFAIVSFLNSCLSVATGTDREGTPNVPYSSLRATRPAAQQEALATCQRQGAKHCKVVEAACSFRQQ